jgi:hypothetical protein
MTPERSQAYGRVMSTLADMGPSKLHPREQDAVRHAADTLLFAADLEHDAEARDALEQMRDLTETLFESERWLFDTADRLLTDIEDCGPSLMPSLEALDLLAV